MDETGRKEMQKWTGPKRLVNIPARSWELSDRVNKQLLSLIISHLQNQLASLWMEFPDKSAP